MRGQRTWLAAGAGVAMLVVAMSQALAQAGDAAERARLAQARVEAQAAAGRADRLSAAAAVEQDAAAKAKAEEAAVAARVQQAAADLAAGQARAALIARALGLQRDKLATQQVPVARLLAALESIAQRPALAAMLRPGALDDVVHVRAVLASTLPVVRARTASIRADLDRSRALQANAATASYALEVGRSRLEDQRLVLARLEASHRDRSRDFGRNALAESDRAMALGEQARDLADQMGRRTDEAATRASLLALPGPAPRPPRAGEVASAIGLSAWPAGALPYRLPIAGRLVSGFGELADSGVRARGLSFAATAGTPVIAPAGGRVAYAGRFRDYGTIVILDHGGGWTTLLTGLATADVRAGATVSQGAEVGRAAGGEDARVTVELRRRDRAVDMTPLVG